MPQVITLGEILVDLVPEGRGYVLRPGGAPSNVAVNLARLGIKSGIIGKLGDDHPGAFLRSFLKSNKVDISKVKITKKSGTGLVFVFLDASGERSFSFYGEPSADKFLSVNDIDIPYINTCRVFHYGTISFMHPVSAKATIKAVIAAKKAGKVITFDPNVRLNLWKGRHGAARRRIRGYFKYADVIKISDGELKFLFGAKPAAGDLKRIFRPGQAVFISAGAKGCYAYHGGFFKYFPGLKVKAVDTTGAGDAFMAGVIAGVLRAGSLENLGPKEISRAAELANRLGAKAVARKGAV